MGYYTCYTLSLENATPEQTQQIIERLKEMEIIGYALDDDFSCLEAAKWYSWEEDMKKLSKEFPKVLFTLHGEGEEQGDIWNCYCLGGKTQWSEAMITIPPFDPKKLTDD